MRRNGSAGVIYLFLIARGPKGNRRVKPIRVSVGTGYRDMAGGVLEVG